MEFYITNRTGILLGEYSIEHDSDGYYWRGKDGLSDDSYPTACEAQQAAIDHASALLRAEREEAQEEQDYLEWRREVRSLHNYWCATRL